MRQSVPAWSASCPRGGPVWFVSAMPDVAEPETAFVHGDEIMVVFTAETMRRLGFPDDDKEAP